jgi:diaminopimelate decarboxylase
MSASTKKPRYERPSLVRHRAGWMNKMGAGPRPQPRTSMDGVPVEELVAAYGSPLFVYSERTIRERYRSLRDQLVRRWPDVRLAWSYKTCYLDAICQIYHQEGALAEVVSAMEFHKAQRMGVPIDQIVYNGPHKTRESLTAALLGGARVHIDHFDELAAAEAIAHHHGIRPKVALRLSIDTETQPRWDRFGFHLDSGQAWDAVRRLVAGGQLELSGLHCHLGTFVLDPDAYREVGRKLVAFARRIREATGTPIRSLDLGGGFASTARLKAQLLPGEQVTPSLGQYAEAVVDGLSELELDGPPPTLILESGRALIDEAGTLISTVVANKRLPDGRRAVILDAGVNLLYTSTWYQHSLTPTAETSGAPEPTMVYGPLCMNIDVVASNRMLPPLPPGRRVAVHPVGAYNLTQSMQFIALRPAVCLVGSDGQHGLIRRAERLEDLTGPEETPAWLER